VAKKCRDIGEGGLTMKDRLIQFEENNWQELAEEFKKIHR
jgi:hypothetical protein